MERSRVWYFLFVCLVFFIYQRSLWIQLYFCRCLSCCWQFPSLASGDGRAQQWVITSAPSPGVGTNETSLPGYCLWATALGAQHCHPIASGQHRAASVTLCHGPLHRGIGNLTQNLSNISAAWALFYRGCHLQREVTLVSVFYSLLGLNQGHWVSLFPTPVKYMGSRQKLHTRFCTSRPCNKQEGSVPGPI